jgi:hypothetical protein
VPLALRAFADMGRPSSWLSPLLITSLLFLPRFACGVLRNTTIDDTQLDLIEYQPPDAWQLGLGCSGCAIHPDKTRAFGSTWHDGTIKSPNAEMTIKISFSGA